MTDLEKLIADSIETATTKAARLAAEERVKAEAHEARLLAIVGERLVMLGDEIPVPLIRYIEMGEKAPDQEWLDEREQSWWPTRYKIEKAPGLALITFEAGFFNTDGRISVLYSNGYRFDNWADAIAEAAAEFKRQVEWETAREVDRATRAEAPKSPTRAELLESLIREIAGDEVADRMEI